MADASHPTVAQLLVQRLCDTAKRVTGSDQPLAFYGVPGDYSFPLCDAIEACPDAVWHGCANELQAGYAADGYARARGLGVLVTTYGVGELSAINAVAGSFAERVPVVCIASSPSRQIQEERLIVHHSLAHGAEYDVFAKMHGHITAGQATLSPDNAAAEIERLLEVCTRLSLPVYASVPEDVQKESVVGPPVSDAPMMASDPTVLQQAVGLIAEWVNSAQRPVILADAGVHRARARAELLALVDATNLPCATMGMGRAVLDESHSNHIGVYEGAHSVPANVQHVLESSDCVLAVGANMTDYNTGGFTACLDESAMVDIKLAVTKVRGAAFTNINSKDVLRALAGALRKRSDDTYWQRRADTCGILALPQYPAAAPPTCDGLLAAVQAILRPGDVVCMDTFTLTFGALPMRLPSGVEFISQVLWGSIGAGLPIAGGAAAALAHDPTRRVVLLIGDGCLQMTATHLGTMLAERRANRGGRVICVLVNNRGYQIEKLLCKRTDNAYNEIPNWRYALLPHVLGAEPEEYISIVVDKGSQLAPAMRAAADAQAEGKLALVEVRTPPMDVPQAARHLGHGMPGF